MPKQANSLFQPPPDPEIVTVTLPPPDIPPKGIRGIGARIARRREELGATQRELADAVDVTRSAIANWETGNNYPNASHVSALAAALKLTMQELLDG